MYLVSSWPRNCWFFRLLLMVVMAGMISPRPTRNKAGQRQMTTAIGFSSLPVTLPATTKTIASIATKPPTTTTTPSNVDPAWLAVLDANETYPVAITNSLVSLASNRAALVQKPVGFGPRDEI